MCMKPRTAACGVAKVGIEAATNIRRASAAAPSPSQQVSNAQLLPAAVSTTARAASLPDATAVGQLSTRIASADSSASSTARAAA